MKFWDYKNSQPIYEDQTNGKDSPTRQTTSQFTPLQKTGLILSKSNMQVVGGYVDIGTDWSEQENVNLLNNLIHSHGTKH